MCIDYDALDSDRFTIVSEDGDPNISDVLKGVVTSTVWEATPEDGKVVFTASVDQPDEIVMGFTVTLPPTVEYAELSVTTQEKPGVAYTDNVQVNII